MNHSSQTMQDVDFLPAEFKRRRTNRHGRSWRIVVGVAAVGLVLLVSVAQTRARQQIEARLASIEPERQRFDLQQAELSALRERLATTEALAELHTYMRHPWPKTQLLAAVLQAMPDSVVFQRIRITRQIESARMVRRGESESADEELAKAEPALRDLRLLEEECNSGVVTIALEGVTSDGIALHRYLSHLNSEPLLEKAELRTLESTGDGTEAGFRFEARLTVRPGFGQPKGPRGQWKLLAESTLRLGRSATEAGPP
jgi:Tfp pilus assembly protein PilN